MPARHLVQFKAPSVVGYQHGLRQPAQTLTLRLFPVAPFGAAVSWPQIDDWLCERLDVSRSDLSDEGQPVAQLAQRILATACALLRAGSVPVFEVGRVLDVRSDPGQKSAWLAQVAIAQVDYFPEETTALAYEAAAILVHGLVANPNDFSDAQPLYQQLETQLLAKLRANNATMASTMVLLEAAWQKNIPWRHLGTGIYQFGWGAASVKLLSSRVETDRAFACDVVRSKPLTAIWLAKAGLPVPTHHLVHSEEQALSAAVHLNWPVVLKPADCDRGEGVSVNIASPADLRSAFQRAKALSSNVLVERQVAGHCHRLLVVRGQVMYVVQRLPIAVQGDGVNTIAQRIASENECALSKPPWRRPPVLPCDDAAVETMRLAGYTPQAVAPAGMWVPLRLIESTADGGRDEDKFANVHPDNAALAIRAAAIVGLDMAGVDLISPDISVSWTLNGAVINEVNAAPTQGASAQSIDAMPAVMAQLVAGTGRIPIEVFVGGPGAMQLATARQQEWLAQGRACYFSNASLTLDPHGKTLPMACTGAFFRCRALLLDQNVQALVLVLQDDECLQTGLPVDRVDRVVPVDNAGLKNQALLTELLQQHVSQENP